MYLHATADQAALDERPLDEVARPTGGHVMHQSQQVVDSQLQQSHLTRGLRCFAWLSTDCLTAVVRVQDNGDQAAAHPKLAQPAHAVQRWDTPSADEEDAADLLLARQQAPFADREHAFMVRALCCLDLDSLAPSIPAQLGASCQVSGPEPACCNWLSQYDLPHKPAWRCALHVVRQTQPCWPCTAVCPLLSRP